MTDVKQMLLDEATEEFEERKKQIEAATDLFPVMNRFMEAYPDTYNWIGAAGPTLYHWHVKKSKALQILDEIFWQNGLETSEPERYLVIGRDRRPIDESRTVDELLASGQDLEFRLQAIPVFGKRLQDADHA